MDEFFEQFWVTLPSGLGLVQQDVLNSWAKGLTQKTTFVYLARTSLRGLFFRLYVDFTRFVLFLNLTDFLFVLFLHVRSFARLCFGFCICGRNCGWKGLTAA